MANLIALFSQKGMDDLVPIAQTTEGALIIDVRSPAEYAQGHVPNAINIPATSIGTIVNVAPDKQTPLFVYCLSGHRSGAATRALKGMGYTHVSNIGGIARYSGPLA